MDSLFKYASALSKEVKWHGGHNENDRQLMLKAGRLSMIYENGNLRYISTGQEELIRFVYSAVRDREWLTIQPEISDEKIDLQTDSFIIKYTCTYRTEKINFMAFFTIEGKADNSIIFSFEGEALTSFEKNRIGFCVLHPVKDCSGRECLITHSNGEEEKSLFPVQISPHQPFTDIKSMKWSAGGNACTLDFLGDIFETEDQRNWTDASYKTYCTPLNIPFPVDIRKGEIIHQSIRFRAVEINKKKREAINDVKIKVFMQLSLDMPSIGIGQSTRAESLTSSEISILKDLRFDHYRADIYLFGSDWNVKAKIASDEASALGYPLEFALFFDDNAGRQVSEFIKWISEIKNQVSVIHIFHKSISVTPDRLTDEIAPLLKKALPGTLIGCGTNANFAQLNRTKPGFGYNDIISYSIHPQEHASDNTSLTENLNAQVYTVESAVHFAGLKGIWISPVNIQRRFNANTANYEQYLPSDGPPPQIDTRMMSLYGACWTVGSLKYLCEAGIKGATFYETVGERGIIQGDFPPRWPVIFKSAKEMVFPVFYVFKHIFKFKSYKVIKCVSSHPLKADALILSDGENIKIILANFTSGIQEVTFDQFPKEYSIMQLDSDNYADAVSNQNPDWFDNCNKTFINSTKRLLLNPFSVSFIDGVLIL
jgi:hypothetical protein